MWASFQWIFHAHTPTLEDKLNRYSGRHPQRRPRRRQLRAVDPIVNQTIINADEEHTEYHRSLFAKVQLSRTTYKIPRPLEDNLIDWDDYSADRSNDLPIFWHILKSGGTTIKLMYAQCYHLVEACESGVLVENEINKMKDQVQPQEWIQQQQLSQTEDQSQGQQPNLSDGKSPWEWMQLQQQQQFQLDGNKRRQRRLKSMSFAAEENQAETQQQIIPQQEEGNGQLRIVVTEDKRKYVNVDITTSEGIQKASQLGFASSNLADVMFTPLLIESAESLFNGERKGRVFAIFRHPIDRVVSIFYYLQGATWEPTYNPEFASWTIDDYARSPYCESNWMVRSLTNKMTGPLTPDDIEIAKEVLRKKCLIGLMERMEESILRFHAYFKFGGDNNDSALECSRKYFGSKDHSQSNSHSHPVLDQGSETWAVLATKNGLDIRLYEFAQELFEEQGKWLRKEGLM